MQRRWSPGSGPEADRPVRAARRSAAPTGGSPSRRLLLAGLLVAALAAPAWVRAHAGPHEPDRPVPVPRLQPPPDALAAPVVVSAPGTGGPTVPAHRALERLGPVRVYQGRASTVVVRLPLPAARARRYVEQADRAVETVRELWPAPGRVVVLVPASVSEAVALAGPGLASLAAATGSPASAPAPRARRSEAGPAPAVVVNPAAFAGLTRQGQQVVLTHEVTHVATASSTGPRTPAWLSEGLADHVAYRDGQVPVGVAAAALLERMRRSGIPARLPEEDAFVPGGPEAAAAYEGAWLAVRLLAERHGEQALVRAYRATGRRGLAAALAEVLGTTPELLTAQWRESLRRLLQQPTP